MNFKVGAVWVLCICMWGLEEFVSIAVWVFPKNADFIRTLFYWVWGFLKALYMAGWGFTLHFGLTVQTETSSATVRCGCMTSSVDWCPSADSSRLDVQLHWRLCLWSWCASDCCEANECQPREVSSSDLSVVKLGVGWNGDVLCLLLQVTVPMSSVSIGIRTRVLSLPEVKTPSSR